jgi:hypothetical protein
MHFLHGFCSGKCRTAIVEYRLRYQKSQNLWEHRAFREAILFPRINTEREERTAAKSKYDYTQTFQADWWTSDTIMQNFVLWVFVSVSPPRSITSLYQETTPSLYGFLNVWCNNYTFCMTFWSRMKLNYPGVILSTQGIQKSMSFSRPVFS